MPKEWTRAAVFEQFGTKPRNFRWSWSARSSDRETVIVALWKEVGRPPHYLCRSGGRRTPMTREEAAELIDIFRGDESSMPPVNPAVLAHAYLRILGSLPEAQPRGWTSE